MKNIILLSLLLSMISCGKKSAETDMNLEEATSVPPYDTIAKDSFSAGAVSVDVARRIRISSVKYQDSLRKAEDEKLARKEAEEKEKAMKKLEEEKKKAEDEAKAKKEKEQKPVEIPPTENIQNP